VTSTAIELVGGHRTDPSRVWLLHLPRCPWYAPSR
jgi:hypothetical protein